MPNQTSAEEADDLMDSGEEIALFLYHSAEPADLKRLYSQAPRLPVFQVVPRGPLHAFKSKLRKHFEELSAGKEQALAELRASGPPFKSKAGKPKRAGGQGGGPKAANARPRSPSKTVVEIA
jgi:hypothetical protein